MIARAVRSSLLARIHRRFQTITETIHIGSLELSFTRIKDPDVVLDQIVEECDRLEKVTGQRESDPQHLPYWAELWESAAGLGQFVVKKGQGTRPSTSSAERTSTSSVERGKGQVLDLGCGMGLSGTVAAALGHRVLFADLEADPLLFARLNSLPWADRVRTRRINWQTESLDERFDLILGADIIYERKQWEHLDSFWKSHLCAGGIVLLGEPGRPTGDLFGDWITGRGWTLTMHEEPVATRPRPIRIFELKRRTSNKTG